MQSDDGRAGRSPRVVGVVRSRHAAREHTPVQAALNPDDEATIELDPRYVDGLDGLEEFSHAWLLTWLADPDTDPPEPELRQVPYLLQRAARRFGIFATRGPRRPSPIGLSLVRLVSVDASTIRFAGVDLLDGTPVLDVKPYVDRFDRPMGEVRSGWFDDVAWGDDITPAALRPRSDD